jgi:uncharacterized protein (DUF924 family)
MIEEILSFWFGDDPQIPLQNAEQWWKKDPAFDKEIRVRFEATLQSALRGECDLWKETPRGRLAYIILFDQFSRNIYRNTPGAFAQDPLALAASLEGQERGMDRLLSYVERSFFYMPMMHSENREIQRRSTEAFRRLMEEAPAKLRENFEGGYYFAEKHREIIEHFGRFPHRNAILGRTSTPAEIEFLKQLGSSF